MSKVSDQILKNLLYVKSSIFGDAGKSTSLADQFVRQIQAENGLEVTVRDLEADPVPHLTLSGFKAFTTPEDERSSEQHAISIYSSTLIDEWRKSEIVMIGLPMYNLGIPSTFKAYLDHVIRAGETFRYTADGPVGLLKDRKVYIVCARGGRYSDGPLDTQTPYMRHILGLIGIGDIEFIYAEGLNMGDEIASESIALAERRLTNLASELSERFLIFNRSGVN